MNKVFKSKNTVLDEQIDIVTEKKDYATFLDSVDELTKTRLNSIDISLAVQQEHFKSFGVTLTETECFNDIIDIKRNQNGYYADESKSLDSNEEYENYQASLEFYNEHIEELEIIHELISDKEEILLGCYVLKKGNEEEIESLVNDLGYGLTRKKVIYEADPVHPSEEYKHLLELMGLSNNNKKNLEVLDEVMDHIRSLYTNEVEIKIKKIEDKYDFDLDNSYGIILLNSTNGDKQMLYAVSGFDIIKNTCDKYLVKNSKYLNVYLKLATSIIKSKYLKKSSK